MFPLTIAEIDNSRGILGGRQEEKQS